MESEPMNKGSAGVYSVDLLLIAFIVLKLTGVINWSWVWVLAPFWIPLLIVVALVLTASIRRR